MRRIVIVNPTVDNTFRTYLSADYTPSGNDVSLPVVSNVSFAANDFALIGNVREELTEGKQVSGPSGSTVITLASALTFSHQKGTSVAKVVWNFVEIERAVLGVWTVITQSAIQWDNRNNETVYFDPNGMQDSEYRWRFYNSVTGQYSEYSPTLTGAGFSRNQVGQMIHNVRIITNDLDRKYIQEDMQLIEFLNAAQDIAYARNPKYWFLLVDAYKRGISIAAIASTDVYSLASLTDPVFGHLESIRYRYTNGSTDYKYPMEFKPSGEFDRSVVNLNNPTDDYPEFFKLIPADTSSANGYFQVYPKTKTTGVGTFYPNYYKKMTDLNSVDDATDIPIPRLLENYTISQVERIKGNETKADTYEKLFFGPPDVLKKTQVLEGLALLDSMDKENKRVSGQGQQLWKWRGRKYYSNRNVRLGFSRDYYVENFMD